MCNDTINIIYAVKEEYSFEYILSLLNSKLVNVWFRKTFPAGLHIKTNQLEFIPIPKIEHIAQQPFVALATHMLLLNQQLQEKRSRFLHRLRDNLGVEKMTSALETFDLLDFKGLLSELKKQKKQISLSQQDEWEDYFNDYRQQCQQLSKDIDETNKQIDLKVYHLYDLTYDEVLIVDPQTTITEAEYKE